MSLFTSAFRAPVARICLPASGFRFRPLAVVLLATVSAFGGPVTQLDLGQNLTYVRLHRLPDDARLLAAAWKSPALIVDVRYPTVDATPVIPAGLPVRPRTAPLLVLTGPDTPADVLAALRVRAPGLITVGSAGPGGAPDLALDINPETDRRAYDALDAGTAAAALIGEKDTNPRFDEAALAREHQREVAEDDGPGNGGDDAGVVPPPAPAAPPAAATPSTATAAAGAPAAPAPPPLKDAVLERAVQLHRALLALGRLPAG